MARDVVLVAVEDCLKHCHCLVLDCVVWCLVILLHKRECAPGICNCIVDEDVRGTDRSCLLWRDAVALLLLGALFLQSFLHRIARICEA